MRELVFALEFRGSAAPVPGVDGKLQARTAAASQLLRTALTSEGVQATVEVAGGGDATFESEVELLPAGTFTESGTISYGAAGTVTFRTVGQGILGPSGIPDLQRGAVIWEVTEGNGQFSGVTGLITSNFTVDAQGAVMDNHFARLFLAT
jgi:hypothetical protein